MALQFPRAAYGTQQEVERQLVAISKDWANDLLTGVSLRPLQQQPIQPGAIVYCSEITDINLTRPAFRIWGFRMIPAEVCEALGWTDSDRATARLEAELLQTPAGILWLNVGWPEPNTLPGVQARISALCSCWDQLASLLYVDNELHPQNLDAVIEFHYAPFLELWLDVPITTSLASRLQIAIGTALAASEENKRQRLAMVLSRLAKLPPRRSYVRLTAPERFDDIEWISQQIAAVPLAEYESALTGISLKRLMFSIGNNNEDVRST